MSTTRKHEVAVLEREDDVKEETTDNMVLRTLFLPISLDKFLREVASEENVSKGEIIRRAINDFIKRAKVS